ncbi:hypothetical protein [Sinorhizobium arboris]|uniref:hypothetical protein n=1 Tax=Sinorhizobium arboris TaxID=76745 RepID=UPI0012431F47|nr:hypothetical protein [Sinorhizobium arboris]
MREYWFGLRPGAHRRWAMAFDPIEYGALGGSGEALSQHDVAGVVQWEFCNPPRNDNKIIRKMVHVQISRDELASSQHCIGHSVFADFIILFEHLDTIL